MSEIQTVRHQAGIGLTLCLALLLGSITFLLCIRGAQWERFHPDEPAIARWLDFTRDHSYITERIYPGGYFELMRSVGKLEEGTGRLGQRLQRWQTPGRVRTNDGSKPDYIYRGRIWNAALMALATMLVFGLGLLLLGNRLAAAIAAFWFGVHPFVVEHGHYAETDAVMMVAQGGAFWLLAKAIQEKRSGLLLAAALAAGLAFGCKYTLLPILLLPLAGAWIVGRERGWGWGKRVGLAGIALVLFGAGFVWATPVIYRNWAFFVEGSRHVAQRTYGEMNGLLGEMSGVPGAGRLLKSRVFLDEAAKIGAVTWWFLLAASPLWLLRRFRGGIAVLPLFGALFALYVVFGLPWFRNQEFLPVLPVLAVTLGLPVAGLFPGCRGDGATAVPLARRLLLLIFVPFLCVVLTQNAAKGIRMSSAFGHIDTRTTLREWMARYAPEDARIGYEPYSEPVAKDWNRKAVSTPKVERMAPEYLDDLGLDYQVCAPGMTGRGLRHPWTQKRFANGAMNYAAFTNRATRLRTGRLTAGIRPTFSQVEVELWGLDPPSNGLPRIDIPLVLNRPAWVGDGTQRGYPAFDEVRIGPLDGLKVGHRRHQLAAGPDIDKPQYVVAVYVDAASPVSLRWKELFQPAKVSLQPRSALLFTLDRRAARQAAIWDVLPSARVRLSGGTDVLCAVVGTPSAAEAARVLRTGGTPERAVDFLARQAHDRPFETTEQVEWMLALAACKDKKTDDLTVAVSDALQADSRRAAEQVLRTLDTAITASTSSKGPSITVDGVALKHLADFARIRFPRQPFQRCVEAKPSGVVRSYRGELPCLLPPGRYTFDAWFSYGSVVGLDDVDASQLSLSLPHVDIAGCELDSIEAAYAEHGLRVRYRCALRTKAAVIPIVNLGENNGILFEQLVLERAELRWSPQEQLVEARAELAAALAQLDEK